MHIRKCTKLYESWLAQHTPVVNAHVRLKHERMAESAFAFLRGTYYRWAQVWPKVCGELARTPQLLSVGDLHVENFGTWRDIEGRLIWGVNDFDEANVLGYANDLVRLATSAGLAIAEQKLRLALAEACDAIVEGYGAALEEGGRPFVLGEEHGWLRQIAEGELRDPVRFWSRMDALPLAREGIPASARDALEHLLPERGLKYRVARRVAGVGSLGRQRYVALGDWRGGRIAREAKALVPSAQYWADGGECPAEIMYQVIMTRAVRCPDPFVQLRGKWIVRRLSPHCSRVELAALPKGRDERRLLRVMGWETANIHLGDRDAAKAARKDLRGRRRGWLQKATAEMAEKTLADWKQWRREVAGR
jgi:hypothetical protein